MHLRIGLNCMGMSESGSSRHRIIINYCAPGESSDLCDVGNTMDFAPAPSSETSSTRASVGSSRPKTFCNGIKVEMKI